MSDSHSPDQLTASTPDIDITYRDHPEHSIFSGIKITLAIDDRDLLDHLVITFAKNGAVNCSDMLESHSTSKLLFELENFGQDITEPSMMAIADDYGQARRVFVTPCPQANFRDYAVWVGLITDTVVNLKARNIALYPCPGALSEENTFDLMSQLIRSLIEANAVDNIALIIGRYNYNRLLNIALELKSELKTDSHPIHIIH